MLVRGWLKMQPFGYTFYMRCENRSQCLIAGYNIDEKYFTYFKLADFLHKPRDCKLKYIYLLNLITNIL